MTTVDLADSYRHVLQADSDIADHLPVLHDLVVDLNAQVVIELGVRWGTSTIMWLHALAQSGGHLWAVDDNPAPFMHPSMTFIQGYDTDPHVLERLPRSADVVFVDTDHTYELTSREILLYAPRVADGGCIVFHDVADETFEHHQGPGYEPQPPYPVRKAVTEAAVVHGWDVDWTEICHGLAVCWPKTIAGKADGFDRRDFDRRDFDPKMWPKG